MFRKNRVPWIVAGVLIVVIAVGVFAFSRGKKEETASAPPPDSARAVTLPASQARTVVVPACNTPVQETVELIEQDRGAPGATVVELPRGDGVRFVLVPHCQPGSGAASTPGTLPSLALALAEGTRPTEGQDGSFTAEGLTARSQLILPNGSKTATVVVPPCRKRPGGKRDVVLESEGSDGNSETVVAPAC
jgi:hypothetical protein